MICLELSRVVKGEMQNGSQDFSLLLVDANGTEYCTGFSCQYNHVEGIEKAFRRIFSANIPKSETEQKGV